MTERLMVEEGYAAVTSRRVAKEAGVTSALVHYYFGATDDLLIEVYRRTTQANLAKLHAAFASDRPLHAFWNIYFDQQPTALALEFMAMANHRKAIRDEIARSGEYMRGVQVGGLTAALKDAQVDPGICPPVCMSVLLAGIWRVLVLEAGIGLTAGHAETRAFMAWLLEQLEPSAEDQSRKGSPIHTT